VISPLQQQRERVHAPLEKTARTLTEPFRDFVNAQSASGWVLLASTVVAIGIANSGWRDFYFNFLELKAGLLVADADIEMSLQHWVNEGLMALFFFLLGLELKREVLVGRLSELSNAASVVCAAVGGMLVPAIIFLTLGGGETLRAGWAIPVATDTAFALMILVMLGDRIPASARAFLVGLAIVDDIGAILIIAIAYSSDLDTALIVPAVVTLAMLAGLNLIGVRAGLPYVIVGCVLWFLLARIGLHGTLAGVMVAAAAPVRPALTRPTFVTLIKEKLRRFEDQHDAGTSGIIEQPEQQEIADDVLKVAEQANAPLVRWETRLERPVSMLVLPLFAFMNAGTILSATTMAAAWNSNLSSAILAGLLAGKPLGILLGVGLGRLLHVARLPEALSMRHLVGIGLLGGIGFTMSLFIATLSFGGHSELLEIARQSVIGSSLCAGLAGYAWLRWACRGSAAGG